MNARFGPPGESDGGPASVVVSSKLNRDSNLR